MKSTLITIVLGLGMVIFFGAIGSIFGAAQEIMVSDRRIFFIVIAVCVGVILAINIGEKIGDKIQSSKDKEARQLKEQIKKELLREIEETQQDRE